MKRKYETCVMSSNLSVRYWLEYIAPIFRKVFFNCPFRIVNCLSLWISPWLWKPGWPALPGWVWQWVVLLAGCCRRGSRGTGRTRTPRRYSGCTRRSRWRSSRGIARVGEVQWEQLVEFESDSPLGNISVLCARSIAARVGCFQSTRSFFLLSSSVPHRNLWVRGFVEIW